MRSYRKVLLGTSTLQAQREKNISFFDPWFLDSGNITGGERRKKLIALPSYRTSVISFVDKKILKKDLNHNFFIQHPELEVREIELTHLRKTKNELLVYALEKESVIELGTVAHAYWCFERLVCLGMVSKKNRKILLADCMLLAIKFLEVGDINKKIRYYKNRWRRFHNANTTNLIGGGASGRGGGSGGGAGRVRGKGGPGGGGDGGAGGGMGGGGGRGAADAKNMYDDDDGEDDDEEVAKADWSRVEQSEFRVYVGLDFALLPPRGSTVIITHMERLLQQINVTLPEYYSRKFEPPAFLSTYNCYSNLYY